MIDSDEQIFAVDESNNPVDPVLRRDAHADGIWHRTGHIWIVNSKREILCNKRSGKKDTNPGKWAPYFGGHFAPDEDPITGTLKELREETGLEFFTATDLELITVSRSTFRTSVVTDNEFQYVHICRWNGSAETVKYEKDEVDEVKWIAIDDIRRALANNDPNWCELGYGEQVFSKV